MEKEDIESYRKAGKIASKVIAYTKETIKEGVLLVDIAEKVEGKIRELGAEPAFPLNLSINEVAAHYTPSLNDKTKAEGILKIDLGVEVNGCIADTAFSVDLTKDKKFTEMIALNEKALESALKIVRSGVEIGKIGGVIHSEVEEFNKKNKKSYSIIKNLTGHSLGKDEIHAGLSIPNYKNANENTLKEVAIAIEPFLTTGVGEVYESSVSEIYNFNNDLPTRDRDARKLLEFVKEKYKTRPFCRRWLEKQGFQKLNFSLSTLVKQGIFHNFPVLIEKSKMPVSQAEHTVILFDEKSEITTR